MSFALSSLAQSGRIDTARRDDETSSDELARLAGEHFLQINKRVYDQTTSVVKALLDDTPEEVARLSRERSNAKKAKRMRKDESRVPAAAAEQPARALHPPNRIAIDRDRVIVSAAQARPAAPLAPAAAAPLRAPLAVPPANAPLAVPPANAPAAAAAAPLRAVPAVFHANAPAAAAAAAPVRAALDVLAVADATVPAAPIAALAASGIPIAAHAASRPAKPARARVATASLRASAAAVRNPETIEARAVFGRGVQRILVDAPPDEALSIFSRYYASPLANRRSAAAAPDHLYDSASVRGDQVDPVRERGLDSAIEGLVMSSPSLMARTARLARHSANARHALESATQRGDAAAVASATIELARAEHAESLVRPSRAASDRAQFKADRSALKAWSTMDASERQKEIRNVRIFLLDSLSDSIGIRIARWCVQKQREAWIMVEAAHAHASGEVAPEPSETAFQLTQPEYNRALMSTAEEALIVSGEPYWRCSPNMRVELMGALVSWSQKRDRVRTIGYNYAEDAAAHARGATVEDLQQYHQQGIMNVNVAMQNVESTRTCDEILVRSYDCAVDEVDVDHDTAPYWFHESDAVGWVRVTTEPALDRISHASWKCTACDEVFYAPIRDLTDPRSSMPTTGDMDDAHDYVAAAAFAHVTDHWIDKHALISDRHGGTVEVALHAIVADDDFQVALSVMITALVHTLTGNSTIEEVMMRIDFTSINNPSSYHYGILLSLARHIDTSLLRNASDDDLRARGFQAINDADVTKRVFHNRGRRTAFLAPDQAKDSIGEYLNLIHGVNWSTEITTPEHIVGSILAQ